MKVYDIPFENSFSINVVKTVEALKSASSNGLLSATVPEPAVGAVTPEIVQTQSNEIPWGKIILVSTIVAGAIYVGYRIYKKRQEEKQVHFA